MTNPGTKGAEMNAREALKILREVGTLSVDPPSATAEIQKIYSEALSVLTAMVERNQTLEKWLEDWLALVKENAALKAEVERMTLTKKSLREALENCCAMGKEQQARAEKAEARVEELTIQIEAARQHTADVAAELDALKAEVGRLKTALWDALKNRPIKVTVSPEDAAGLFDRLRNAEAELAKRGPLIEAAGKIREPGMLSLHRVVAFCNIHDGCSYCKEMDDSLAALLAAIPDAGKEGGK